MGAPDKPYTDLGLSYEEAAHGVQSAIAQGIHDGSGREATSHKHLRVGVDMSKSDMYGLAMLLMEKGVFTLEEYAEHTRLAANTEVARFEEEARARMGVVGISFR